MGIMDTIMQSTGRWTKFVNVGDAVTGKILSIEDRQYKDFTTGKPGFWDDGNPKLEVVLTVATDIREDADDDGHRTFSIKGWGIQRDALRDACQKAGRPPVVGDMIRAAYVGDEKGTGFVAKRYEYTIKLQTAVPDPLPMDHGIVPPYVEEKAKAYEWPEEETPF